MSTAPDPFAAANTARPGAGTTPDAGATAAGGDRAGGEQPSLGELVSEVSRDLSTLVRQEVELAKAEAKQSAQRAGKGAGMFGGAGIAGHFVLLFLSIALWWGLGTAMGWGWSAVVVAVVWAVVAAVLALLGRKEMRAVEGMPRTTDSVKKIPHALQGHEEKNA
ncbi:phage holin family protein [Cellulosimicrobium sp. NPDC057127]|uniref:phage holin family protein n=1 Tax=Cellulosimicrobium sp. NPDC057127 TaxID=3346026 RepID=UPI00363FB5EA